MKQFTVCSLPHRQHSKTSIQENEVSEKQETSKIIL
jgi:hypothetical protein